MSRIAVAGVGKKYKRYARPHHRLLEWLTLGRRTLHQPIWVLKGVDFRVEPGEALGIIGQNGAGKSTLLKIITGTTQPTEGEVRVQGRVAALLELGMGFHPDFTGRQNAVLSGQIMGLSPHEIHDLMSAIEEFAEIGPYMDQPLRTYSSGMAIRLAFSVATALRPDILIVDEALAVGDAYFQHKCFRRIREFKAQGTTLLFVSHDPGAVKTLCNRAILLDRGMMVRVGEPDAVLDYYNAMIAKRKADEEIRQAESLDGRVITRSGNRAAEIVEVELLNDVGTPIRALRVGERMQIRCRIAVHRPLENPTVGILLRDRLGNDIFGTNTYHLGKSLGRCRPGSVCTVGFTVEVNLGVGHYSVTVAAHELDTHLAMNYDWLDRVVTFQVVPGREARFVGVCYLPATAEATLVEVDDERILNDLAGGNG